MGHDPTTFGNAATIVLHPNLYGSYFKPALAQAYPDGEAEARTFLGRIEALRNKLAHGATCSVRDLEQCVCYANDLIDSIKVFFVTQNQQRLYNVPLIARVVDTRGNELHPSPDEENVVWWLRDSITGSLTIGETLGIEIEVDPTFDPASYKVQWRTGGLTGDRSEGRRFSLVIAERHVTSLFVVNCTVISDKTWHRYGSFDDQLNIAYRVLPPT
jgi:hypothetical protein